MEQIFEAIFNFGIIPVIQINRAEAALPLAEALAAGGLPCAEITFRTAAAEDSIRAIAQHRPDVLIGAGTVLTTEQARKAAEAGAKFVVSPGLNPKVVNWCLENGMPIIPGVSTASDIEAALELGLTALKFFPAEASGGIKCLKALSAPYGNVRFLPTGGISADNLGEYLAFDRVLACGGSWMVPASLIDAGDFKGIEALTRNAVSAMLGLRLAHVGINTETDTQATMLATLLCDVLGMPLLAKPESYFAGDGIEVMRERSPGQYGHIAIACSHLGRAMFHMRSKGWKFDETQIRKDAAGKRTVAYLQGDFGGFALHLVEKR